jgi:hypothetical protein
MLINRFHRKKSRARCVGQSYNFRYLEGRDQEGFVRALPLTIKHEFLSKK